MIKSKTFKHCVYGRVKSARHNWKIFINCTIYTECIEMTNSAISYIRSIPLSFALFLSLAVSLSLPARVFEFLHCRLVWNFMCRNDDCCWIYFNLFLPITFKIMEPSCYHCCYYSCFLFLLWLHSFNLCKLHNMEYLLLNRQSFENSFLWKSS